MRQRPRRGLSVLTGANAWGNNINYTVGSSATVQLPLIAIPEGVTSMNSVPTIGTICVRSLSGHVDFSLAPQVLGSYIEHTINFSVGVYKTKWSNVLGNWSPLDPSIPQDVCVDSWATVDGMTFGMFQHYPSVLVSEPYFDYNSRLVHDVSFDFDVSLVRGEALMLAINANQWGSNNSFLIDITPWIRIFYDVDEV